MLSSINQIKTEGIMWFHMWKGCPYTNFAEKAVRNYYLIDIRCLGWLKGLRGSDNSWLGNVF